MTFSAKASFVHLVKSFKTTYSSSFLKHLLFITFHTQIKSLMSFNSFYMPKCDWPITRAIGVLGLL